MRAAADLVATLDAIAAIREHASDPAMSEAAIRLVVQEYSSRSQPDVFLAIVQHAQQHPKEIHGSPTEAPESGAKAPVAPSPAKGGLVSRPRR